MAGAAGAASPLPRTWNQGTQDAGVRALPRLGTMPQRYLLISSEPERLAALAAALTTQPAEVTLTYPAAANRHRVLVLRPDVVLLDLESSEQRRRVLEELRGWRAVSPTPVLAFADQAGQGALASAGIDGFIAVAAVGVAGAEEAGVGVDAGADAALPWNTAQILAGLHDYTLSRRRVAADVIEAGPVVLDVPQRSCRVGGSLVDLTFIEFEMLKALASQPNRFFDPLELLRIVWDGRHPVRMVTLRVWIKRLRDKLPSQYRVLIETRRSVGYRLALPA